MSNRGVLMVISGPSGVGKGTVIKHLFELDGNCYFSVSATTRAPRPDEVDGVHYHFINRAKFEEMTGDGEMLEHDEHFGNLYGTPRFSVEKELAEGHNVVLDIEYKGMRQVRKAMPDMVSVLVLPPSVGELERRLRDRATEDERSIGERLSRFSAELQAIAEYDYIVVNDRAEDAAAKIEAILTAARCRPCAMGGVVSDLLKEETHNA